MQYTSCFIGVPLSAKFQEAFEKLLTDVGKLYPNWEITYPKTPHITVYYLDKQSQYILPDIAEVIQAKISIINNLVLTISGFDYFTKKDPKEAILFLDIVYPPAFADFNRELTAKLGKYYALDNNLPFRPHMTVAGVNGLNNNLSVKDCIANIEDKTREINWEFPVTEIVLYGVDSTKQPQYQEKLIHIPIK